MISKKIKSFLPMRPVKTYNLEHMSWRCFPYTTCMRALLESSMSRLFLSWLVALSIEICNSMINLFLFNLLFFSSINVELKCSHIQVNLCICRFLVKCKIFNYHIHMLFITLNRIKYKLTFVYQFNIVAFSLLPVSIMFSDSFTSLVSWKNL